MTAMQAIKAEVDLKAAILDAINKAVKAGLDSDQISAVLEQVKDAVDNYGIDD